MRHRGVGGILGDHGRRIICRSMGWRTEVNACLLFLVLHVYMFKGGDILLSGGDGTTKLKFWNHVNTKVCTIHVYARIFKDIVVFSIGAGVSKYMYKSCVDGIKIESFYVLRSYFSKQNSSFFQ